MNMQTRFQAAIAVPLPGLHEPTFQTGFLSQMFDKIYVINLASRTDRYREMATQLTIAGLSFDHPSVEHVQAQQPLDRGPFDSIGARGCYLSHLDVLRRAVAAGHQSILILEDDAEWTKTALSLSGADLRKIATTRWDFLHGGDADAPRQPVPSEFELEPLAPAKDKLHAHFIGLRGPAIALAKAHLETLLTRPAGCAEGGPMHVDGAYSWLRRINQDLSSYICAPGIAQQRSSRSDISPPTGWKAIPPVQKLFFGLRYLKWLVQRSSAGRSGW